MRDNQVSLLPTAAKRLIADSDLLQIRPLLELDTAAHWIRCPGHVAHALIQNPNLSLSPHLSLNQFNQPRPQFNQPPILVPLLVTQIWARCFWDWLCVEPSSGLCFSEQGCKID